MREVKKGSRRDLSRTGQLVAYDFVLQVNEAIRKDLLSRPESERETVLAYYDQMKSAILLRLNKVKKSPTES